MKRLAAVLLPAVAFLLAGHPAPADQPAGPPKPPAEAAPLTEESLQQMLTLMGYEPKVEKTASSNIYTLTIKRDTWTYVVQVSLSPNKSKLWLSGWLGELPPNEKIPVEKLLDLLEGSWNYGPTHFRYYKKFRQINLGLCLENRNVTSPHLRENLEDFMDTMKKTELLWNAKKWENKPEVTVGKPAGVVEDRK